MAETRTLNSRYTLEAEIGRGGMGVVYRAEDAQVKRTVAIKTLPSIMTHNPELMRRFNSEVQHASKLSHPNIARVYDVGEDAGTHYYVMQFIDGKSLRELLKMKGRFSIEEALPILEQVASALDYAHSQGIVHRDIKPENILLDQAGNAYVVDFGIAKAAEGTRTTRGMLGTPEYMSPEQIRGEAVDGRSDQYSLAVVAYEMLTGRTPFQTEGDDPWAQINQHLATSPPDPRVQNPELSEKASSALLLSLEKDRDERYADCQTLINGLDGKTVVTTKQSRPRSVPVIILCSAAIMIALGLLFYITRSKWTRPVDPLTRIINSTELVYAANIDGMLSLYGKTLDGRVDRRLNITLPGDIQFYRISPDGNYIRYYLSNEDTSGVYIWSKGNNTSQLLQRGEWAKIGSFNEDSRYGIFVTGTMAYRWNSKTNKAETIGNASSAVLSADGMTVIYANDKKVYRKEIESGKIKIIYAGDNKINNITSSGDMRYIVVAELNRLFLIEDGKKQLIYKLAPHMHQKWVDNPNGYNDGRGYTIQVDTPCDCVERIGPPILSHNAQLIVFTIPNEYDEDLAVYDRKDGKIISIPNRITIDQDKDFKIITRTGWNGTRNNNVSTDITFSPDDKVLYLCGVNDDGQFFVMSVGLLNRKFTLFCPGRLTQIVRWKMPKTEYDLTICKGGIRPVSVPVYSEVHTINEDFDDDGKIEQVSYAQTGINIDGAKNGTFWFVDDGRITGEWQKPNANMFVQDLNNDSKEEFIIITPMRGSGCFWDCFIYAFPQGKMTEVWSEEGTPRSGRDVMIVEKKGMIHLVKVEALNTSFGYGDERSSRFKATYLVWKDGTFNPSQSVETSNEYQSVEDALKELKIIGKSLCPSI